MKKLMLLVVAPLIIVACSEKVETIEFYEKNPEVGKTILEKCEVTQGSEQDQNCINAKKAKYNNYMRSQIGAFQ